MKNLILTLFCFFVVLSCTAQNKVSTKQDKNNKNNKKMEVVSTSEKKSYKGVILEKPWTKSTQSYCAQGSDYFVLKLEEQEWVIENKSGLDLKKYHEKEVTISGFEQTRKIPAKPENPFEQRPVTPSFLEIDGKKVPVKDDGFTCTVLVVESLK